VAGTNLPLIPYQTAFGGREDPSAKYAYSRKVIERNDLQKGILKGMSFALRQLNFS